MHPWRTTISCRCFARIAVGAALLTLPFFGLTVRLHGQALPDTVEWSVSLAVPPAGGAVMAGSMMVVPLSNGVVTAHRLFDGEQIWSAELAAAKPLAADADRVYIASGEAVHALTAATGTVAWSVPAGGPLTAAPLAHAGWVIAAAAGDLFAIRAADGVVLWRKHLGPIEFPAALDGELLVVSLVEGRIVALDLRDGVVRWETGLGAAPGEPVVIGGRVYVGTRDKRFYALRTSSGRVDYNTSLGAELRGRVAVDDRHVYFAAMDNMLRALSRGDGALRWKQGLPYRPASGPVLIGTLVVVPGYVDTPLQSFAADTGRPAGTVGFGALLVALPAFTELADGRPAVGSVTGGLDEKWRLSLRVASLVPVIALVPLTVLPGEVVALPEPPGR